MEEGVERVRGVVKTGWVRHGPLALGTGERSRLHICHCVLALDGQMASPASLQPRIVVLCHLDCPFPSWRIELSGRTCEEWYLLGFALDMLLFECINFATDHLDLLDVTSNYLMELISDCFRSLRWTSGALQCSTRYARRVFLRDDCND